MNAGKCKKPPDQARWSGGCRGGRYVPGRAETESASFALLLALLVFVAPRLTLRLACLRRPLAVFGAYEHHGFPSCRCFDRGCLDEATWMRPLGRCLTHRSDTFPLRLLSQLAFVSATAPSFLLLPETRPRRSCFCSPAADVVAATSKRPMVAKPPRIRAPGESNGAASRARSVARSRPDSAARTRPPRRRAPAPHRSRCAASATPSRHRRRRSRGAW